MKKSYKKIKLNPSQEEYIKMYHEYFVLCWSQIKIAEQHDCTSNCISDAIKWVNKNKLNISSDVLVRGAVSSVRERLSNTKDLYEKERTRPVRSRDNKMVLGLIKEIREDEKLLYKLQEILSDGTDDSGMTASSVLKLIKEASKPE